MGGWSRNCLAAVLITILYLVGAALWLYTRQDNNPTVDCLPRQTAIRDLPRFLVVVKSQLRNDKVREIFREGPVQYSWLTCHGHVMQVTWRFLVDKTQIYGIDHDYIDGSAPFLMTALLRDYDWDYLLVMTDTTVVDLSRLFDRLLPDTGLWYASHDDLISVYTRTALQNLVTVKQLQGQQGAELESGADLIGLQRNQLKTASNSTACVFLVDAELETLRMSYRRLMETGSFC